MRVYLTSDESRWLMSVLQEEKENLHIDLSGADDVNISRTAIRILNKDSNIVLSIIQKLEE